MHFVIFKALISRSVYQVLFNFDLLIQLDELSPPHTIMCNFDPLLIIEYMIYFSNKTLNVNVSIHIIINLI